MVKNPKEKSVKTVSNNIPKAELQKRIASGRSTLLTLVIFTVVNVVLMVMNAGYYMLFSASIPYYLTAFGLDLSGSPVGTVLLAIAAGFVALLLLSWLLSKKKGGWMICGMILMILDSLALVGLCLLIPGMFAENILDLVFHAAVLYSVIRAVAANKKLQAMVEESPVYYDGYTPGYNGSPEF